MLASDCRIKEDYSHRNITGPPHDLHQLRMLTRGGEQGFPGGAEQTVGSPDPKGNRHHIGVYFLFNKTMKKTKTGK